ncbi:MAG: DUF4240 domain-containing protein [Bacteroidota bacterium]
MDIQSTQIELIRLITDIRSEELLSGIKEFIQQRRKEVEATSFSEEDFWNVMMQLDWKAEQDEAIIAPSIEYLSQLPIASILSFYDLLSEKLYHLDGEKYAVHSVKEDIHFSADLFLYARCAIVANGRDFYNKVLRTPSVFPKDLFFESLLYLPEKVYRLKTGKPLEYMPKFIYETGFNVKGWGEKAIQL